MSSPPAHSSSSSAPRTNTHTTSASAASRLPACRNPNRGSRAAARSSTTNALSNPPYVARCAPQPLLAACDHWLRRPENQSRVVGILLGSVSEDGSCYRICDSFPVHILPPAPLRSEDDAETLSPQQNSNSSLPILDIANAVEMYSLLLQASPRDIAIGWYSSSPACSSGSADEIPLDEVSAHLHNIIESIFVTPLNPSAKAIHMTFDPALTSDSLNVKAYVGHQICGLDQKQMGRVFTRVPLKVKPARSDLAVWQVIGQAAQEGADGRARVGGEDDDAAAHQRIELLESRLNDMLDFSVDAEARLKAQAAAVAAHGTAVGTDAYLDPKEASEMARVGAKLCAATTAAGNLDSASGADSGMDDLRVAIALVDQACKQLEVSEKFAYGSSLAH